MYLTVGLLGSILHTMNIINKYFSKQLIGIFVMLLLILAGLAWMVQIMSMMKFLMNYGIKMSHFLGMTMMMIPFIVSIIIPFVTFIAILFVYNKMISDNEIVVMSASGCSPARIARPAMILAGILTVAHLILNVWIVPATQAKFYDTQWNLRYGLAHLKLQESAFTEMSRGLVVYVDKVSGHNLKHVMLSDTREAKSDMTIFAENGQLVSTIHGLSIVMTNGSINIVGKGNVVGTFDSFDMDLSLNEKKAGASFGVRRMSTSALIKTTNEKLTQKQSKAVVNELCSRFLGPLMNLILAGLCLVVLLRSSLLRRRTSFAPAVAVITMSVVMATFMSLSGMLTTMTDLMLLFAGQVVLFIIITFALLKK